MLRARIDFITVDPALLDGVVSYLGREVCPLVERTHDSREVSLLVSPESAVVALESAWATAKAGQAAAITDALTQPDAISHAERGIVTEEYEVMTDELRGAMPAAAAAQLTRLQVERSALDDAVEVFGDTVVPSLAELDGFRRARLLVDWTSGRSIAEITWRDPPALQAARDAAESMRTEVVAAANCVIQAIDEYHVVFSAVRKALYTRSCPCSARSPARAVHSTG